MNENPEGMPNPLNPNPVAQPGPSDSALDANPSEPEPMAQFEIEEKVQVTEPVVISQPTTAASPITRPMEQAPVATTEAEPAKKKKTGLIIGIIIAAIMLIGGGIAAALIAMNINKGDVVVKAIEKIVSGNMPAYAAIDGTFTIVPDNEDSAISSLQITLNSEGSTTSMLNSTKATALLSLQDGGNFSVEIDEIYAASGDLYFKVDGLTTITEDYLTTEDITVDYEGSEDEDMDDTEDLEDIDDEGIEYDETMGDYDVSEILPGLSNMSDIIEVVDGEWLRISLDEINDLTGGDESTNSNTACMVDMVSDIRNYSSSVASSYNKNAFISSTTNGVTLASKSGGPVYKVIIDEDKFASFVKTMQNSELVTNLFSCMGYENLTINANNVVAEIDNLPTLYVEVDKNDNFTRLYLTKDIDAAAATLTADVSFSYPSTINIAEPTEYTDLSTLLQEIFTNLFPLTYEDTDATITD